MNGYEALDLAVALTETGLDPSEATDEALKMKRHEDMAEIERKTD